MVHPLYRCSSAFTETDPSTRIPPRASHFIVLKTIVKSFPRRVNSSSRSYTKILKRKGALDQMAVILTVPPPVPQRRVLPLRPRVPLETVEVGLIHAHSSPPPPPPPISRGEEI